MIGKINHIAIVVPDLLAASERWRDVLGAEVGPLKTLKEHGVRVAFVRSENSQVELMEPFGEKSPLSKFLNRNPKGGLHHICYEVDNIDEALEHAQQQGATLRICQACQVVGSHPHPEGWVAFLDDEAGGIEIEFMQVYTPEQLKEFEDYKGI